MTEQVAAPVRGKERIDFVDILRGFAVLGILVVNMYSFAGAQSGANNLGWQNGLDRIIIILSEFLIRAKFYTLFSFLFGWGMGLQLLRAQERGVRFVPLYLRRLIILLIFGLIHGILIWSGDILTSYAMMGFLLLLFRNQPPKRLLIFAVVFFLIPIILNLPSGVVDQFLVRYREFIALFHVGAGRLGTRIYADGTYNQVLTERANTFLIVQASFLYYIGGIFGMFLIGLHVAKRRIFESVDDYLPLVKRVLVIGLILGVVFNGLFIYSQLMSANISRWPEWVPEAYRGLIRTFSLTIGAPSLALFYTAAFILITRREAVKARLASTFGVVGRMALTNYLMHSIISTLIFYSYGLGLYGSITPRTALIFTVIIFYIQIRYSRWWFVEHQYGPAEWLWRTLTYGRRQPWRKGETYADVKPIPFVSTRAFRLVVGIVLSAGLCFGLYRFAASRTTDGGGLSIPILFPNPTPTPVVEATAELAAEETTFVPPNVSPVTYNPGPLAAGGDIAGLAEQFNLDRALDVIDTLSGEPYDGRLAGTEGGWAAGDYIAQQFEAAGLQPVGDDGTFYQAFPIETISLVDVPSLVISGPNGTTSDYDLYHDYNPLVRGYMGDGSVSGDVVWVNNCDHSDFNGLDLTGKIAFCRAEFLNQAPRQAVEHGAIGLLLLAGQDSRPLDLGIPYGENWLPEGLALPTFMVSDKVGEDLLAGSGISLSELTLSFRSFPLAVQAQLAVDTQGAASCTNQVCQGRNILGVIPGRDPDYADEVVIIGGHYDHIGQGPDGTVWPGANDNASGVAVMLEIARSWHEQGYVPRRTVVFAAWDAEEMGLLGSLYYVNHPRYQLENTVAVLNLDMVGAGEDTLYIDSGNELGTDLLQIATASGVISTTLSSIGRSDHYSFQLADVPATMMIWFGGGDGVPSYHRPEDTPAVIEPEKLAISGRIAETMMLSLTEGEMALQTVADERAAAVLAGDEDQFLTYTAPDWRGLDEIWFKDVESYSPVSFEMTLENPLVVGVDAYADVSYELGYQTQNGAGETVTRTVNANLPGHFIWSGSVWQWAGGHLETATSGSGGLTVLLPVGATEREESIADYAQERYQVITNQLGLSQEASGRLRLFRTSEMIRAETALSFENGVDSWTGFDTLKLTYSTAVTRTERFQNGLVQLVLSNAGLTQSAAPWLWDGLAPVIESANDPVGIQREYLPEVAAFLRDEDGSGETADGTAESWAAVQYVREQLGWQGLGELIVALGQACQSQCQNPTTLNGILRERLGVDNDGLVAAWQERYRARLAAAESAVDSLLTARVGAVHQGDKAAFLATVDDSVPGLMTEQSHWFDDLSLYPVEAYTLTGVPLAFYDDGRILASVDLTYSLIGLEDGNRWAEDETTTEILLTPGQSGLLWADVPLERLPGSLVDVYYPSGELTTAESFQSEAEMMYQQLAADLGFDLPTTIPLTSTGNITETGTVTETTPISTTGTFSTPAPVTLKLYRSDDAFRQSVFLSYPLEDWLPAWTAPNESVKILLQTTPGVVIDPANIESYRPALSSYLARTVLNARGVESEWLVKGVAAYETSRLTGISPAADLRGILKAISEGTLQPVTELGPDYRMDEDAFDDATVQSWDVVRFLVENNGLDVLADVLDNVAQGMETGAAITAATGQSLADLETNWLASVSQAHI
ncbi:MAG: M20/M25/M40 family metallo-hydrolase, partial [Candidatus Promineifilaceae bacterium]